MDKGVEYGVDIGVFRGMFLRFYVHSVAASTRSNLVGVAWRTAFNNETSRIPHLPHGIRLDTIPTKLLTTALTTCSKIWYTANSKSEIYRASFGTHRNVGRGLVQPVNVHSRRMWANFSEETDIGCTAVKSDSSFGCCLNYEAKLFYEQVVVPRR